MRVLLVALNAKYVHTNLALRYLQAGVKQRFPDVVLREYTINDSLRRIIGEIYEAKADVVGFSCYIWNIQEVKTLVHSLRLVCPHTRFVLGGPEVSFGAAEILRASDADTIVVGEGEETFAELLAVWERDEEPVGVYGLVWRRGEQVIENPPRPVLQDLSILPFPYGAEESFSKRLAYVETTRGCPFNCQYCLSSSDQGVRFLAPEQFRITLRRLLYLGARTIKFVDRTFNASKAHAFAILDIVKEEAVGYPDEKIRVHCEIAGELLDEDWRHYLRTYPEGLIQLEIGVQSTYAPTLRAIRRQQNFHQWEKIVRSLRRQGIPLHMDLIAGLPLEGWQEFQHSFNEVYRVQPQRLQLGFLKLLRGSGLRKESAAYGLKYSPEPPYTVLETQSLRFQEILWLERVEELLERYYNSGKFTYSLQASLERFPMPFVFYHRFAMFWHSRGWFGQSWQGKALFNNLWEFIGSLNLSFQQKALIREAMRLDYYLWERPGGLPEFLKDDQDCGGCTAEIEEALKQMKDLNRKEQLKPAEERMRAKEHWETLVPQAADLDRRHWARSTAVAYFKVNILSRFKSPEAEAEDEEKGRFERRPTEKKYPGLQKDLQEKMGPKKTDDGVWYLFYYDREGVKVFCRKDDESII